MKIDSDLFLKELKTQLPHLKTQAQFSAFAAAFDALLRTLDAVFAGDPEGGKRGQEALLQALDVAGKVTGIIQQVEEIPEDQRSPEAAQFVVPPNEFHEHDIQKRLLVELEGCTTLEQLNTWYTETKDLRDRIVGQSLRNVLLDSIRARKAALLARQ